MGNFFSLGSRVLHKAITLLSFGTTQTCPLFPVTYPPSVVMAGVSTNLGPVVRLEYIKNAKFCAESNGCVKWYS
jgi:hypothetical protein